MILTKLLATVVLAVSVLLSNPKGYAALERNEGRVLHAYPDSAGYHTIGVGHLLTERERTTGYLILGGARVVWTRGITSAQADALLKQDVAYAERAVTTSVKLPLLQNQYDALVSFVFNIGSKKFSTSHLLVLLNRGDYADVPNELQRWESAGGKHDAGLVARRLRESALWRGL